MNFVLDSGNTLIKWAVFDKKELVEWHQTENLNQIKTEDMFAKYPIDAVIISDVSGYTDSLALKLKKNRQLIRMSPSVTTPIKIKYASRKTLGSDRIAAAVAGNAMFPENNTLVIQTGTCITYEIINEKGEYLGGAISPGLDMRLKALNTFTAHLPLVKKEKIDFLIGNSTHNSILSGVINGCIAEADGIIDRYKKIFPELKVVLSGGDTFFFDKRLKNRIFATANLVLTGLNIILEHNK
jgi:type III pantothenate kinase